jgi:hypothetical protein
VLEDKGASRCLYSKRYEAVADRQYGLVGPNKSEYMIISESDSKY